MFAEEFQGYHLWVKRDASWLESCKVQSSYRSTIEDFFVEDGHMYRKDDAGAATCIDLPDELAHGVMSVLSSSLTSWFDAFEACEHSLGLDLRRSLQTATPSLEVRSSQSSQPSLAGVPEDSAALKLKWEHAPGSWWGETLGCANGSAPPPCKAVFTCGSIGHLRFVTFYEGGAETYSECSPSFEGLVVKLAGTDGDVGCFRVAPVTDGSSHEELAATLERIKMWASAVPEGAHVMLAVVSLQADVTVRLFEALAELGVPTTLPRGAYVSFAAIGRKGFGSKVWEATFASSDVAYVAQPVYRVST